MYRNVVSEIYERMQPYNSSLITLIRDWISLMGEVSVLAAVTGSDIECGVFSPTQQALIPNVQKLH